MEDVRLMSNNCLTKQVVLRCVYTNMLQAATRIIKYVISGAGVRVVGKEEYKTNKNRKNYRLSRSGKRT